MNNSAYRIIHSNYNNDFKSEQTLTGQTHKAYRIQIEFRNTRYILKNVKKFTSIRMKLHAVETRRSNIHMYEQSHTIKSRYMYYLLSNFVTEQTGVGDANIHKQTQIIIPSHFCTCTSNNALDVPTQRRLKTVPIW